MINVDDIMKIKFHIILYLTFLNFSMAAALVNPIAPTLQNKLLEAKASDRYVCWVFFADKGQAAEYPHISDYAMKRRSKTGRSLTFGDLPVKAEYIKMLLESGAEIRTISPWLNAVSIKASLEQIKKISGYENIRKISEVGLLKRPNEMKTDFASIAKDANAIEYGDSDTQIRLMKVDQLHQKGYSGSGVRLTIIDTGFDRWHEALKRVKVIAERDFQRYIIDTISIFPFATDTLPDTVASYDPLQDTSRSQTWHGTGMLSIAGGYKPGSLIGSAYNADYILAKTEMYAGDDFQQEEDWFVAAVQWATDSIGTDIISSSLGYRRWSDDAPYSYSQMDGRTSFCALALDSAYSRGVLVLNSLGNVNSSADFTQLTTRPDTCLATPADARHIISVGGVWASTLKWADPVGISGERMTGASAGPPADSILILPAGRTDSAYIRRIKPEIASSWQNYYAYNEPDDEGNYNRYASSVGTSGATVLTAGLCALLLEAHPSWGPDNVMNALKQSGSNRSTVEAFFSVPESLDITLGTYPNFNPGFSAIATGNKYYTTGGETYDLYDVYRIGWGVPDGIAALYAATPEITYPEYTMPEKDELLDPYPNPVKSKDGGVYLPYYLVQDSYNAVLRIYTLDGRQVKEIGLGGLLSSYPISFLRNNSQKPIFWDLRDYKGNPVPGGLYIALLTTGWNQSSKKIMVIR
jgi:hypothetical protein